MKALLASRAYGGEVLQKECGMVRPALHEEFTLKAEEATVEERQAKDPQAKLSWERIAVGYLELADMARRRDDHKR